MPHEHDTDAYTMAMALHEAREMLETEFGKASQDAAVALASVLHAAHSRDQFLRRQGDAEGAPYGAPEM